MAKEDNLDNTLYVATSKVLKELREEKNISLEELSNKMDIDITRQALHKYETGKSRITVSTFNSICKALGKDPSEVFRKIKIIENNMYNTNKDELITLLEDNISKLSENDKLIIKTVIMEKVAKK